MDNSVCKKNVTVTVDALGRIVIRKIIAEKLGLLGAGKLKIEANENSIFMEKIDSNDPNLKIVDKGNGFKCYMIGTGIVRNIDELNRIVLPIEFRLMLGIKEGNMLNEKVEGNKIVLTKV